MFEYDITSMFGMNQFGISPYSSFGSFYGCQNNDKAGLYSMLGGILAGVTCYAVQNSQHRTSTGSSGSGAVNGNIQQPEIDEAIRNDKDVKEACKFFGTTDYKEALKFDVNKDALVKDYDARIKTAQKEVDILNTNLDNIKAQINALDKNDANYNTQFNDLDAQKKDIEDKIKEIDKLLNGTDEKKGLVSLKEDRIKDIETQKEELYKAVAKVVNQNKALIDKAADKADASWIQRRDFRELFDANDSLKANADVKPAHVSSAAKAYTEALPGDKERMGRKFIDLYNKLDSSEKKGQLRLFYNMIKNAHPKITEA